MPDPSLMRDAQRVTAALAKQVPYETAAAWVHAGALVQHATGLGLIEAQPGIEAGVKAIADAHPALAGLADPAVNRMWTAAPDDLGPIDELWRQHSVADPPQRSDGYALGDLYQAISEESRKGRALCQTPKFVSDLLLHTTLPHALNQWGLDALRMIDPSCGAGHILIESFVAIYSAMRDPFVGLPFRTPAADRIRLALAAVHGVDLDPYAAAIARYRLLALACRMDGGRGRLDQATVDWTPQVACADSLLATGEPLLERGRYHLVIGNPPYITVKDPAVNEAIRAAYPEVCSGKYSLALPFFQLMTDLMVPGGWCAQLTANSFMKREFGKKFIEQYLPRYDLRWLIDTSGAYIPGHGTPTVIMVHRNQPPESESVRAVLGKKGEPSAPEDPANGLVWSAIRDAVWRRESVDRFVASANAAAKAQPEVARPPVPQTRPVITQPSLLDLLEAA